MTMMKLLAVHGLVKFIAHVWNDPSMSWLPGLLAVLAICCILWIAGKLVLHAWRKFHTSGVDSHVDSRPV
jgi:hypothetical protein